MDKKTRKYVLVLFGMEIAVIITEKQSLEDKLPNAKSNKNKNCCIQQGTGV